jgi:hypothetical protein
MNACAPEILATVCTALTRRRTSVTFVTAVLQGSINLVLLPGGKKQY